MTFDEESLKYSRDMKNIIDTAREEGRKQGLKEARNVKNGIIKGYSNEIISDITGISINVIQKIREKIKNI